MFTGIVQTVGTVNARRDGGAGVAFEVLADDFSAALRPGDSVAINGVCHTVESCDADGFTVTAVGETLAVTTMSDITIGARVNLEQAATLGTALGGHLVQGHVDGIGHVQSFERQGDDVRLAVRCEPEVAQYLVPKGSVAIDGVSLTVVRVEQDGFDVALIPHTLEVTTLGARRPGDTVNLEADVLGKYVKKYLERLAPGAGQGGA